MLSPQTIKRFRRFRQFRRSWWSLIMLAALYILSLGAELFCGSRPLAIRHQGRWYWPLFAFHAEGQFIPGGGANQADYLKLHRQGAFKDSLVIWPVIRNDPYRIIPQDEIAPHLRWHLQLVPQPRVAGLVVGADLVVRSGGGLEALLPPDCLPLAGRRLDELWELPDGLLDQIAARIAGKACAGAQFVVAPVRGGVAGLPPVRVVLAQSGARARGRASIRMRLFEDAGPSIARVRQWWFEPGAVRPRNDADGFEALPPDLRWQSQQLLEHGREDAVECVVDGAQFTLECGRENARFPFRPFAGHWLGLDDAGRDVFARIFYALRLSLNFGMILVVCSLAGGSLAGMAQGYLGGKCDMIGQRLTEIWSALPFLYIMILMGAIYGTGFLLLLACYALFNWIGISYYMRAETLRLKKMPYVEAARCLGVPGWRIVLRHILPNALVPLITFFPFSLVGAVGALAALDYLGFGLPPPVPSLGELLAQAQAQRHAWWLILYPSMALFAVMILGVFIGEGVRNAFEPRTRQVLK